MVTVEIIAIGNEILIGDVLDTNTHWLCKQITGIGGRVDRAVLVRDDLDPIVGEVQAALGRNAEVIFTTGGLGPTADDMTLEAVARATQCPLALNAEALDFVRHKYEDLAGKGHVDSPALTPAREKMALLPTGATPLANPVGAAPGVLLRMPGSTLVCFPGVPTELRAIFESSLQPFLKEKFGDRVFLEKIAIVNSNDESVLAPILHAVAQRHPEVYVKSRARSFGPDITFRVTVSVAATSKEQAAEQINMVLHDLAQALGEARITIDSVEG